jgi:hypothetical protein
MASKGNPEIRDAMRCPFSNQEIEADHSSSNVERENLLVVETGVSGEIHRPAASH